MALMHPPELPIAVLADSARRHEVEIFKLLAQKLDNSFHVFFRPCVGEAAGEHSKIADFIILHNTYGLLGIAIADDATSYQGTEQRPLPYSPIRSALRSLIFGLKEQGIRFYIPAPCCVIFPRNQREQFVPPAPDLDYAPLFASDFPDLQNQISRLMPITSGYQSTWRVPDAVEKIMALLRVNTQLFAKNSNAPALPVHTAAAQVRDVVIHNDLSYGVQPHSSNEQQRIVYVIRAVDIVLAFATIIALIMLISFVPDGIVHRIVDYSRSLTVSHSEKERSEQSQEITPERHP